MAEKNKSAIAPMLIAGFISIILLFIAFGVISLFEIRALSKVIRTLYNHPLVVSNASLHATVSMTKMHRSMKDIALFDFPSEINTAISAVNEQERMVYENFDIVKKNILGDKGQKLENETRHLFVNWKPIREEVIKLVRKGQRQEAAKTTMGKGADHVAKLEDKMLELTSYARNKATGFMAHGEIVRSRVEETTIILMSIGTLLSIIIAFFTIRRTQATEVALRESETLQRALMENLPAGVFVVDPVTRIIESVNEATASLFGAPEEHIVGHRCHTFLCPASEGACPICDLDQEVDNSERELLCVDGSRRPVLKSVKRIQMQGQEKLLECFVDVTKRKQAEEALRESEEKYRNILESMEEGYYEVDLAGNFIFFNNSMGKIFGYSREELMGMNNREYVTTETAKKLYQIFNQVYRTGESTKIMDYEFIRKDGTTITTELSTSLMKDRDNRPVGFRGVCRDITERKRSEELKGRLETQLQQSQKLESIGILAAGMAHDFNNLLTRILGDIDILKDDIEPESSIYNILRSAEKECLGARVLTERFQDFSGDLTPILNSGSIVKILKDSATQTLSGTNVKREFSIHDDLSWVQFDDRLVRRAINNLILNAVESMPDGGIVRISAEDFTTDQNDSEPGLSVKPGQYVRISIQDEGIGIPDENLSKIFDPYFSTKDIGIQQGMGLGLAIAYSIIKKHNGYIYVDSKVGIGTTACIYLPALEE